MKKEEIKKLAKKIRNIELKLEESYDSNLMNEINNLIKDLSIEEIIQIDEEINKYMGMYYGQK